MREFSTAVEAVAAEEAEDLAVEFRLVERDAEDEIIREKICRAYPPTDGQLAMMMAGLGRHSKTEDQIASVINFFVGVLDEESHQYIVDRLLDRNDPLGLAQVQEIIEYLTEEWSGRPTESPSVSTRSRQSGGQKSTRSTSKSTSSVSRRTAS